MQLPFVRRGAGRTAARPSPQAKQSPWSTARFILTLVFLAWAVRSLVFQPFFIPSGSMLPTMYVGDYLVVAKWPYGYSRYSFPFGFPAYNGQLFSRLPKRGDVVVFRHPSEDEDLVKRVIGLPGDTVELRGGEVILNGHPVPRDALPPHKMPISANSPCEVVPQATPSVTAIGNRSYCLYPAYRETLPGGPSYTVLDQAAVPADDFPPTKVPAGHIFLLGDNRDNSGDSRFPADKEGVGMVPIENLIGRATVTFWSTDGSASWWKPWTWFTALRGSRIGNGYTDGTE
jgi:signal peptidase I